VRKAGNRVRITVQLIDTQSGAHLWADRFDGSLEDIFELQDKVAISVAGVIEPALRSAEVRRSIGRPTKDVTAYDLYLRASKTGVSTVRVSEAVRLLEQAIARDPNYGAALALAAMGCVNLVNSGSAADQMAARRKGIDFARRALEVDRDNPRTLVDAAFSLAAFGEDIGAMIGLVDRSLHLDPSAARGWFLSGVLRLWSGQPDLAIEHARAAQRLNPRETAYYSYVIGAALFLSRRFEKAAPELVLAITAGRPSRRHTDILRLVTPIWGC